MANQGVPKGKPAKGDKGGTVSYQAGGSNSLGVPDGQTPGLGKGNKEVSMNQLPSTAKVRKPSASNLMTGMSQSRGAGGAK